MSVTLPSAASIPSRISGVAPLPIFFDWSALTSTLTADTFRQTRSWIDFGDGSAGVWAVTGLSKNRHRGVPMAAHTYENPGTYVATIRAKDAVSGAVAIVSVSITVDDPATVYGDANTYCFSNDSDFTGAPAYATTHRVTTSNWATVTAQIAAGRQILLKCDDTFSGSSAITLPSTGPGIVGMFGNGARPIINYSSFNNMIRFATGVTDWRLADLDIVGPGVTSTVQSYTGVIGGGDSAQSRTLCLRLRIRGFSAGFSTDWHNSHHTENFLEDCDCTGVGTSTHLNGSSQFDGFNYGMYWSGEKCSVQGYVCNDLAHPSGDTDGHPLRLWHARKMIVAHCSLGNPTGSAQTSLKIQSDPIATSDPTEYIQVSSMKFLGGTQDCVHIHPSNPQEADTNRYAVVEGCLFLAISLTQFFLKLGGPKMTARNNVFNATGAHQFMNSCIVFYELDPSWPDPDDGEAYNNTFYMGDNHQDFIGVKVESPAHNTTVRNNLLVVTNAFTGTKAVLVDTGISTVQSNNLEKNQNTNNTLVNPGSGDYHLNSGSDARNAGTGVTNFDDYDDLQRFEGAAYDVGAFEFGGSTFPYGPDSTVIPHLPFGLRVA